MFHPRTPLGGKAKLNKYDPAKRMSSLVEAWISKANAKQRKGRAGRVSAGHCFRLYTRQHFDESMAEFEAPEMLRAPVESLVLQVFSPFGFFSFVPVVPHPYPSSYS